MYADPVDYDCESPPFNPEGTLLLQLATEVSGPLLELGCGTGCVTIPLAKRGAPITALDVKPGMIRHAQDKAVDLPVNWVCDDVRTFQLQEQFALIFTYGLVFQHLISRQDQEAMLARVHEHLTPKGIFCLDVSFKHPQKMVDSLEEEDWYSFVDKNGNTVQVSGKDSYDHLNQIWRQSLTYRRQDNAGKSHIQRKERLLRYFMPQDLQALLHYSGFVVRSRYGDWKGRDLIVYSYQQIYVCTKRE